MQQRNIYQRYEMKFLLERRLAGTMKRTLSPYLHYDEHAHKRDGERVYRVRTLYFDAHDFSWYHEKISGVRLRRKLRIRVYEPEGERKTFLEIRTREEKIVSKIRVPIDRSQAENVHQEFLSSFAPGLQAMIRTDGEVLPLGIRPILLIEYERIAFFSRYTRSFRLTFDYDPKAMLAERLFPKQTLFRRMIPGDTVVLELKFSSFIPPYILRLIEFYDLKPVAFSKFCQGLAQFDIVEE